VSIALKTGVTKKVRIKTQPLSLAPVESHEPARVRSYLQDNPFLLACLSILTKKIKDTFPNDRVVVDLLDGKLDVIIETAKDDFDSNLFMAQIDDWWWETVESQVSTIHFTAYTVRENGGSVRKAKRLAKESRNDRLF
jgi:hypothetical protein